jgi:hypothetical protein
MELFVVPATVFTYPDVNVHFRMKLSVLSYLLTAKGYQFCF